jgi:hypothetical protein
VLPYDILWPRRRYTPPDDFPVAVCHPLAVPTVCSLRQFSGRRVPSTYRAGVVLGPPPFRSPRAIRSPCRRFARPADLPVSACYPVPAPAVRLLRRLSGSHLLAARRAGGMLAPATFRSRHTILLPHPPLAQPPSAIWTAASDVTLPNDGIFDAQLDICCASESSLTSAIIFLCRT